MHSSLCGGRLGSGVAKVIKVDGYPTNPNSSKIGNLAVCHSFEEERRTSGQKRKGAGLVDINGREKDRREKKRKQSNFFRGVECPLCC
jgi:hypothetical protein